MITIPTKRCTVHNGGYAYNMQLGCDRWWAQNDEVTGHYAPTCEFINVKLIDVDENGQPCA